MSGEYIDDEAKPKSGLLWLFLVVVLLLGVVAALYDAAKSRRQVDALEAELAKNQASNADLLESLQALNHQRHGIAPQLLEHAQLLKESGDLESALEALGAATAMVDIHHNSLFNERTQLHAEILQAQLKLFEAGELFAQLPEDVPFAAENARLCAEIAKVKEPTLADISPLYLSLRKQKRFEDAQRILKAVSPDAENLQQLMREQLVAHKLSVRSVECKEDGSCRVNMRYLDPESIEGLRGLPITHLILQGCRRISDLEPLRGMMLVYLNIGGTAVTDLSPLEGMPLDTLVLQGAQQIEDLSPLAKLPLKHLNANECRLLKNISPVSECPIESFHCKYTKITDISPMKKWPLTNATLGPSEIRDISVLRDLPLKYLSLFNLRIRDMSPIAFCQDLESLDLHPPDFGRAAVREIIDGIPTLKMLNHRPIDAVHDMSRCGKIMPPAWMAWWQEWQTIRKSPPEGWQGVDFDDSEWLKARAGFGRLGWEGSAGVGLPENLYARTSFELESLPEAPFWRMLHRADATVFLNGVQVLELATSNEALYRDEPFSEKARGLLREGRNVLAFHSRRTGDHPGIDIGILTR